MVSLPHPSDSRERPKKSSQYYDPNILSAARQIYRKYFATRAQGPKEPCGVAVHRRTHRGHVLFNSNPILLPGESLISLGVLLGDVED